jgi:hypothetical protein
MFSTGVTLKAVEILRQRLTVIERDAIENVFPHNVPFVNKSAVRRACKPSYVTLGKEVDRITRIIKMEG